VKSTPGSTTTAKSVGAGAQNQSDRIAAARARNAATRAAADRRRSREGSWLRRQWPMVAAVVTVLLLIAVFFAISRNAASSSASIGSPVPASVMSKVTGVSQSTFEKVGKGTIADPFKVTQGNPPINKDKNGKPILLYVGGDYCPYCAAERWSMVMALSRFGTFNGLTLMESSSTDSFPNTNTFTFHGATYTSDYLNFQGVETADRSQQPLGKLSGDQQAVFDKYNAPPYIDPQNAGAVPFLSVSNQYVQIGAAFIPDQMQGLTWQQIADNLNDPNNSVTQSIVANANYMTAAICQITDNKPANVCTAAPIPSIISDMKAGK
jgi:thiol-disulfide isomerase/thioredoxin